MRRPPQRDKIKFQIQQQVYGEISVPEERQILTHLLPQWSLADGQQREQIREKRARSSTRTTRSPRFISGIWSSWAWPTTLSSHHQQEPDVAVAVGNDGCLKVNLRNFIIICCLFSEIVNALKLHVVLHCQRNVTHF